MKKYPETLFNVVLVEPEIPQNTGTTGRSCVGYWSHLHLVGKLGFDVSDKQLKRAGLDYWPDLEWSQHPSWEMCFKEVSQPSRLHLFSKKAETSFYDAKFEKGDWLVFGKETKGLDSSIVRQFPGQVYRIPFPGPIRSFNLSNSVAMVLSEAFRQLLEGGWTPPLQGGSKGLS
jgi:tRNA (cytidine/uridine-2'-O-)-methyltransferase